MEWLTCIKSSIDYIEDESLIPVENVIISMTVNGYIKRLPSSTYGVQHRGGRGITGMTTREDDVVENTDLTEFCQYVNKHAKTVILIGEATQRFEENLLNKQEYQNNIAWGIYLGIMDYFYN